MPMYSFSCPSCGKDYLITSKIDERDDPRQCLECGDKLNRLIDKPGWVWSPTSGKG